MRTTLTLDDDVGEKLREAAHRERKPFREVVNEALRLGLGMRGKPPSRAKAFRVQTFRSEFRTGVDERRLNQVLDQLEVEASGVDGNTPSLLP